MEKKFIKYAFIDSQNLNLGVRSQGWQLDFAKFRRFLKDKFKVSQAFIFIGYMKGNEDLYTYLQKSGYILIFKPTLELKKGDRLIVKGNVDAELVLHSCAIEFSNYQGAIIVSGDGDFHCLYEFMIERHKLIQIIIPNKYRYSSLLKKFMKYIHFLNYDRDKIKK
jgi:uncharacterized LabA/DUF88 family protein